MTYDIPPNETPDGALIVAPDLKAALETGGAADVLVTFLDRPSAAELASLGLQAEGRDGAKGLLDGSAVAALEQRGDVASIGFAPRALTGAQLGENVDSELVARFDENPDAGQLVAVWFSPLPDHATLTELGLMDTGGNPATGRLNRAQVVAVAQREDVERINLRPEMDPS